LKSRLHLKESQEFCHSGGLGHVPSRPLTQRPRRVLYAVKGEDLVPGKLLDLKSMQEAGEEIYNNPGADEEMKNVVELVYAELPEVE
jgi:hypothetical protein